MVSAAAFPGSTALQFVISTGAPKERSGEISVWMLFLGNVFRHIETQGPAVSYRSVPGCERHMFLALSLPEAGL